MAHKVHIFCDASANTGLGHFMRSCALANALSEKGYHARLCGDFSPIANQLAENLGIEIKFDDTPIQHRTEALLASSRVVIDSYDYQPECLDPRHHYVIIDDFCHFEKFPVAGVVNFTIGAGQYDYVSRGAQQQALGTAYFLPNPTLDWAISAPPDKISKILIMIGSGDRQNIALHVLDALQTLGDQFRIRLIGDYSASRIPRQENIHLISPTISIGKHLKWADFCITSGGLAKYECAWLGRPAAVISQTPGEQAETLQFQHHGLCFDLGHSTEITTPGLVDNLAWVLSNPQVRHQAHQRCREHFSNNSPRAAADFVLDCLR